VVVDEGECGESEAMGIWYGTTADTGIVNMVDTVREKEKTRREKENMEKKLTVRVKLLLPSPVEERDRRDKGKAEEKKREVLFIIFF